MKLSLLYEQLENGRVRCNTCLRHCVIAPGRRGVCGTRENTDGALFSLIDNLVSSACLDPIEKKPLYHFYPGSLVYSLGTFGCSFSCPGCQNAQISRRLPIGPGSSGVHLSPSQAVAAALHAGAAGICWTYNEPAIWLEHTLESAQLARENGLYTVFVTNGTATREQLDIIGSHLDAYRVDIKAYSRESYLKIAGFAEYEAILDNVRYAREQWGMHVECVTNVTPTINDSDEDLSGIAHWIADKLGVDIPWHVTRFHPYEGFANLPPTPLDRLDQACAIGRAAGLRYIYVGNVPGDSRRNTCCPSCGYAVIQRQGFEVVKTRLTHGCCAQCGAEIAGVWH